MLLPCQTKLINYINVFWRDCVPAGRIVTSLQKILNLVRLWHDCLNQSRASAVLRSNLIAIKFRTAEASRASLSRQRASGRKNQNQLGDTGAGKRAETNLGGAMFSDRAEPDWYKEIARSLQCGPGSIPEPGVICGLSLLLVLSLLWEVFLWVLRFSPLLKNQHF